jgi:hypothetical protein
MSNFIVRRIKDMFNNMDKIVIEGKVVDAENGFGADVMTDDYRELSLILDELLNKRVRVTIEVLE